MNNGKRRRHHRTAEREACRIKEAALCAARSVTAARAATFIAFTLAVFTKGMLFGLWLAKD